MAAAALCNAIVSGGLTQNAEDFNSVVCSAANNHPTGGATRRGEASHQRRARVGPVVGSLPARGEV